MRSKQQIADVEEIEHLLSSEWFDVLRNEFNRDYWKKIINVLNKSPSYLPRKENLFAALNHCKPQNVKVVILGQDPYLHSNQAHGFSFSVPKGTVMPPSLRNVMTELSKEYNMNTLPSSGCLIPWADDGVLLLNSVLTVEEGNGKSGSHKNIGWEYFTSAIIHWIDNHNKCVFLAWGKDAQKICSEEVSMNKVLTAGHPSPMNTFRPFVGCNCFKEANDLLKDMGLLPVRWLGVYDE